MRNLIASEMGNKFKAKRFNGRGNRRADSNRNQFDWKAEMQDAETDSIDFDLLDNEVSY